MSDLSYTLKELTPIEATAITAELQAVLAKYDCEMGVSSSINIMKRQNVAAEDGVLSPIQDITPNGTDNSTDTSTSDTPPTP